MVIELDRMLVAKNIRVARAKKGYTLEKLSKVAGVGMTTLSFAENAKLNVRLSTLEKIAQGLDTTLEEIMGDYNEKRRE